MEKGLFIYFLVPFAVLLLTFIFVSEKELFKSLFYTVAFIIALWINIPCYINGSDSNKSLMYLPVKLSNEFGIIYSIMANAALCIMLYFQVKFVNNDLYTQKRIKKKFDKFVNDANELYIIGKDIDFLEKTEYKVQTERIKHLGNQCKLLCEVTNDKKLVRLYRETCELGVGIKCYTESDNITNLKGQIKIDQKGYKKAIFVCKQDKKYEMIKIDNQFLIAAILEKYIEIYEDARDP